MWSILRETAARGPSVLGDKLVDVENAAPRLLLVAGSTEEDISLLHLNSQE